MCSSSILAKLITCASIFGIVVAQRSPLTSSTAFTTTVTSVIPTTSTDSGQCRSRDLGGTTANLQITFCIDGSAAGTPDPIRDTKTTLDILTGWLKSEAPSGPSPILSPIPTDTGTSRGSGTTKSGSTPTGGTGDTTKSGSTPTGSTGDTAKSGSTHTTGTGNTTKSNSTSTGGTGSGPSSGAAVRNGGSVVAVVLLGSLVGFLGSW
ncbi:hypothetical protein B9Z19DRAFT_1068745 [Tuber borchii]|uniref:Uncharacterized protein n=1 Tax=Tuber borchii TaxID=42251 RepID=A0A2T6ZE26_TUBBO|nr:hypothetical protein B9Z19DRAFT_1068745 [Tuber borchii]